MDSSMQVLIIGGGPTGLLVGSLLRDKGVNVTIVERRKENTRTRPVKLSGQVLDIELPDNEINFFSEKQLEERTKAIESMQVHLFAKLVSWLELTTPIKKIQDDLREYFTSAGGILTAGDELSVDSLKDFPDRFVIDCTGYHSLLLDRIQPNNRVTDFAEFVIVWTFTINARYECNELCKYYKNLNVTRTYQVIPSVHDTYIDENRITHVTCLITIDRQLFDRLSQVRPLTLDYLLQHVPDICSDMDQFLKKFADDDVNKFPNDVMEYVALPLHVYHVRKCTHIATDLMMQQSVDRIFSLLASVLKRPFILLTFSLNRIRATWKKCCWNTKLTWRNCGLPYGCARETLKKIRKF